jgi:invasion protein IalB
MTSVRTTALVLLLATLGIAGGAVAFGAVPGPAEPRPGLSAAAKWTDDRTSDDSLFDSSPRVRLAQADGGTPAATLPGGASSVNETFQDWAVSCVLQAGVKRCVLSQIQTQQNGQRVLGVELNAPAADVVTGTLMLPFGVALDAGVTLQVDDLAPMAPLRFRTCLPAGCVVSLSFDAATVVAMRAGSSLKLKAVADGGGEVPFTISLAGFSAALDRTAALAQ